MVAETLTGNSAKAGFPVYGPAGAGVMQVAVGTYSVAANVEDGDIFEMCKLPKGAVVVGGWLYADDLDQGTEALDMDVGWAANGNEAADPDGFGNFGVWTGDAVTDYKPEVGVSMPLGGVLITTGPQLFTAETTIQIEANVAANSFVAGPMTVVIHYFVDDNYSA